MSLFNPLSRVSRPRPSSVRRRHLPLGLESLEDRVTPAVFNVNSLADVLNPAAGVVTLRSAIQQANQTPGGNTINLTVAGDYRITIPGANTGTNASGAFAILPGGGDLSIINTSGGTVAVDGGGLDRVFDINPVGGTVAPKFTVTIQGVTIDNGLAQPGDGAAGSGGGIRDQGNASLTLINDLITNNAASADGGGVSMENLVSTPWTLTLNNTTVTNNRAGDAGGGIETDGSGKVNVTSSNISNNISTNQGAGIWLDAIAPGTITNPVITNGGTGYTTAPNVVFVNGAGDTTGTGATGFAVINNGAVVGVVMTNAGTGYTQPPKIVFIGGGGNNAAATATANNVFQAATLNVSGTQISGNLAIAADNFGGGIGTAGNGAVTVTSSTVSGNFSGGNGGGYADENGVATLEIVNSTFTNNSSIADGGGVFEGSANPTTILNSTFTGNSSQNNAGGIEVLNGNLVLNNTIVAGNFVGPMNFVGGGLTAVNLTSTGGIIPYSFLTTVKFTNAPGDTTGNGAAATATLSGGKITAVTITNPGTGYQVPPTITFFDPAGGTGAAATATINGAAPDVFATVTTGNGDFIGIGDLNLVGLTKDKNGNQVGTLANPLNPLLGPLQNNGGPTLTRAPLPGSPVLNTGVNLATIGADPITGATITDQRGFTRFVGTAVDIGAVEFQPGATVTTLTTSTANVIQGQAVTLTAHVAPASAAPNNPVTGTVTFTDGNLTLGTATLDANGNATLAVTNLPVGKTSVLATYNPDAKAQVIGFTTSTSTGFAETVALANVAPTVTLTTTVTTVTTTTFGGTTFTQTVTLTVKVTPPANSATPTGSVTLFDGNVALNATPLTLDATGTATLQLTGLPMGTPLVGGQTLTAVYTPDAGATANGYITATSKPAVVTVGTPAEIVLNQLFEDLLHRPVNAGDLNFWVPQLGDQTNPANQAAQQAVQKVAAGILASNEFLNQDITWLFKNYLNRTPNQNDLNFWVPQFQKGLTNEQAATMFVTSPEFISKNGSTSDGTINGIPSQQLITILFQSALGRTPQQKDFTSVAGQTLQQLVNSIFTSPEYHGHTVDVFYQDFLRRTAKNGEATFWTNFYPGGPGASQVPANVQPVVFILSGFIGSQEYIQNAINNPLGEPAIPDNPLQASIT